MAAVYRIKQFLKLESSSGILLAFATVLALLVANSTLAEQYMALVNMKLGALSLQHWINDGLMVIFFFIVGLEIKKEIQAGELRSLAKASFPLAGAIGGMVVPALIYFSLNSGGEAVRGWGIPMATDIAFAMAVLALFGNRVPLPLKIFLLALAIVDDLGAVLVIAFFYTLQVKASFLGLAAVALGTVILLQKWKVKSYAAYVVVGIIAWGGILLSGVHATIAGVILGLMTPLKFPADKKGESYFSPLENLIHALHPWVSFGIMPIFAFFNSGISLLGIDFTQVIHHPSFLGIALGLVIGKPVGILMFTVIAVKLKIAALPQGTRWGHIAGVGALAGMGFTMSLFISGLALSEGLQLYAKAAILGGSLVAAFIGAAILSGALRKQRLAPSDS